MFNNVVLRNFTKKNFLKFNGYFFAYFYPKFPILTFVFYSSFGVFKDNFSNIQIIPHFCIHLQFLGQSQKQGGINYEKNF